MGVYEVDWTSAPLGSGGRVGSVDPRDLHLPLKKGENTGGRRLSWIFSAYRNVVGAHVVNVQT